MVIVPADNILQRKFLHIQHFFIIILIFKAIGTTVFNENQSFYPRD